MPCATENVEMAENNTENKSEGKSVRFSAGTKKSRCHISRKMLPIKAIYFISNSAFACLAPYLPVYMKLIGLTASESGAIIGLMPFVAFVVQPFIGMIADRWAMHKVVMVVAVLITGTFNVLLSFVPPRTTFPSDVIIGDVIVTCHPRQPLGLSITHCFNPAAQAFNSEVSDVTLASTFNRVLCPPSYSVDYVTSQSTSPHLCDEIDGENTPMNFCPQNIHDVLTLLFQNSPGSENVSRAGSEHEGGADSERMESEVYSDVACTVVCPPGELPQDNNRICLVNEGATLSTSPSSSFTECDSTISRTIPTFPETFLINRLHKSNTNSSKLPHDKHDNGFFDTVDQAKACVEERFQITSLIESGRIYNAVQCYPRLKLRCSIQCKLSSKFRDACLNAEKSKSSFESPSSSSLSSSSPSPGFLPPSPRPSTSTSHELVSPVESSANINATTTTSTTTATTAASASDLTFWLFFVFYLFGYIAFSPVTPLVDAACYRLLKDDWGKYGQNRTWATMGWLVVAMVMSAAVYLAGGELRYRYLFYSYGAGCVLSALLICLIPLPSDIRCGNVLGNMRQVLALPKVLALLVVAMVAGIQLGTCSFILWFLEEEFQAPPSLFAPIGVVQVLPEVIGFFFVGGVVKRFGPTPCICFGVLASSVRLMAYCLLDNPWMALLVEPLYGLTVSPILGAASVYIEWVTPPGLSATSQSLLCGFVWSLGRGIGVILTGTLFGIIGSKMTFLVYAVLGVVTAVGYAMLYRFVFGPESPPGPVINIEVIVKENDKKIDTQSNLILTVEPVLDDPSTDVTEKSTMLPSQLYANGGQSV